MEYFWENTFLEMEMITNFKDQPLQAQVSNSLCEVDEAVWFCHLATLTFVLQSLYLRVAGVRG